MSFLGKKTTVVLVDTEVFITLVDKLKQNLEVVENLMGSRACAPRRFSDPLPLTSQTVVIIRRVVHRKQPPRFRVETEKEAVKDYQRMGKGLLEVLVFPLLVTKQTGSDQRDGLENLISQ
jgi:hypothetical protein